MPRIPPQTREKADPASQKLWDEQVKAHGRMTNMKMTLAHDPASLRALMEWYPLRDTVEPFLGKRLTVLFAHAVSAETDCLICSTFFRRLLKESGEDPDRLKLDAREDLVCRYGRLLAKDRARVDDATYAAMAKHFDARQMVAITAFGAMMVATNIINNALDVPLDDYLEPFRFRS